MALWRNWTGDQRCAPHAVERPRDEAELRAAIARASDSGLPVRAAGAGHSFGDIVCTDGVLVSLERMCRVLDADPQSGLVRAEAGITIRALAAELARRGLAMENQGDVDPQSIAGAVSTATHGTGARFVNISGQLAALRLVTAEGEVLDVSADDDRELMLAARVGLGALGLISEVTLRCVPTFTIHRVDEPRPLDEVLPALDELVDSSDHFELFALPYTRSVLTLTSERTDRPPSPRGGASAWVEDRLVYNHLFGAVQRLGRAAPRLIPRLNRLVARTMSGSEHLDLSHRVYAHERDVRFTEMEYAIPRAAGAVALERVLGLVERRRLAVGFPIEMRFVAPDDAYLSPAHARETCYIAVHVFRGMEFESYFRGVEEIMGDYGGRPHWGKRHYQTAATLSRLYPEWDRFQAVRARLDPAGLFRNAYTDRVLGPPAVEAAA